MQENNYLSDENKQQFSKSIKKSRIKKHNSLFGNKNIVILKQKSQNKKNTN